MVPRDHVEMWIDVIEPSPTVNVCVT